MSVPPHQNSHVKIWTPKVMELGGVAFGGDWVMGVKPSWMEFRPFYERPWRVLLHPCHMQGHNEKTAIYEPWSGPSLDTKSASALILHFVASGTVRNTFLLLISHPGYAVFLWQKLQWTKTISVFKTEVDFPTSKLAFIYLENIYVCFYCFQIWSWEMRWFRT